MQHAYNKDKSTATTRLTLHKEWRNAIDKREVNLFMGIDISAVFDVVDKDILIRKMEVYGVDRLVTIWWSAPNSP